MPRVRVERPRSPQTPGSRLLAAWRRVAHLPRDVVRSVRRRLGRPTGGALEWHDYASWIRAREALSLDEAAALRRRSDWLAAHGGPRFSVLLPIRDPSPVLLARAIDSVVRQVYPAWELCVADASGDPAIGALIASRAAAEPRLKVSLLEPTTGRAAAANAALALASGDRVALLEATSELAGWALHWMAEALHAAPDAALAYSDEDTIDPAGERSLPYFKCAFNYDLLLCHDLVSRLAVYPAALVREIGGLRDGCEGAEEYDLALRATERANPEQIVHVPRVLYHARAAAAPTARRAEEAARGREGARRAVRAHLARRGVAAEVLEAPECRGMQRVRYRVPDPPPLVLVVVPTRDRLDLLVPCLESIRTRTTYPSYRICVVDNGSVEPGTLEYLGRLRSEGHEVLRDDAPFNYSRLNNRAVREVGQDADFVCLLNNDTEVLSPDWLDELVGHAVQPGVGCVGARLWYPDGRLQHGGVVLGLCGCAGHAHRFATRGDRGYMGRAALQQSFSAVTAACLLVSCRLYDEVGGLDEAMAVSFNDVDFCLKVRAAGRRNVWTPYAELVHHESVSRGIEDSSERRERAAEEAAIVRKRWRELLDDDPCYSPHLTLEAEDFSPAPSARGPRLAPGGRFSSPPLVIVWRAAGARGAALRDPAVHFQSSGRGIGVALRIAYWAVTFQLRAGLRRRRYARLIRRSGLFDTEHYLSQLSGAQADAARADPVWHFLERGADARLDPNPFFDISDYVARYPHSAARGKNPLVHFIRAGIAPGCDPGPGFDVGFYVNAHPDVHASGMHPLAHYLLHGRKEGRACTPRDPLPARLRHLCEDEARAAIARFQRHPVVSVVVPCYETEPAWLVDAVDSVRAQFYPHWELLLVDDGSRREATRATLAALEGSDPRIRVLWQPRNGGISRATNAGLEAATGEFLALLDHDDRLAPDALFETVRLFVEDPALDAIYTDQDKMDESGRRFEPFFKPDWSPELFRGVMYVGHLLVVRRALALEVGGFDPRFDKVQDFEFMLRIAERTDRIAHVPKVLYHWRTVPGSVARGTREKSGIVELQAAAVSAHLARLGAAASVDPHPRFDHRVVVRRRLSGAPPLVSIVIPTKDAPQHIARCLDSIIDRTTYPRFEVIVVDNGTTDPSALHAIRKHPVEVVPYAERFNFSVANNRGVERARGEIVVLLNNDTEVIDPDWLESLVAHLQAPGVGAVGPVLLYPDRSVQHAGVVIGFRGTADHVMRGFPADADGYAGSLSCTREVSAVTGACLALRRADYLALGGLVDLYAVAYQDVDLCLRMREMGRRILCVACARLFHHEGATRGKSYDFLDRVLLLDTWGALIARGDPYYNPNFTLERHDYTPRRGTGC
jgi:GT2 family glycosyltransferase